MCETIFTPQRRQGHPEKQRFCSYKCRYTHRDRNVNHVRRTISRHTDTTREDIRALLASRTTCPLCKKRMTMTPGRRQKHVDHIVPINIGGTHTIGNLRVICRTCNLSRPSDGSDLTGHAPTLWALDARAAEAASVLRATKPKPPPKLPPPPDPWKQGRALADRTKRDIALLFRLNGIGWEDIANRVGYASAGAAHNGASLSGKRRITTCNL